LPSLCWGADLLAGALDLQRRERTLIAKGTGEEGSRNGRSEKRRRAGLWTPYHATLGEEEPFPLFGADLGFSGHFGDGPRERKLERIG